MKLKITLIALITTILSTYAQTFVDSNIALPNISFSTSALADVDGDNDLDLYLSGMDDSGVAVGGLYLYNNGSYTLSTSSNLPPIMFGESTWGDIDNDGDMDIILIGEDASYTVFTALYINDGNGVFTNLNLNIPAIEQGSVALIDYNNDGFLDITYSGIGATERLTKFFTNNGNHTFTELTTVAVPGLNYGEIAWADYDNDGDKDFIISGFDDNTGGTNSYYTKLFINDGITVGVPAFTESSEVFQQGWLGDIAWVDYNNDNNMDLMLTGVGGSGDERFSKMYKNNGDGTFTDTNLGFAAVSHSSMAWKDFDSDGDLDLFLTGVTTTPGDGNNVSTIYRNDGSDTFVNLNMETLFATSYYGDADSGDINNDGKDDIIITGYTGNFVSNSNVYLNHTTAGVIDTQLLKLTLYPNPSKSGLFKLRGENNTILKASVYTSNGQKIKDCNIVNGLLNLTNINSGLYFVTFSDKDKTVTKKIVIE